jgi:hypothetical protein
MVPEILSTIRILNKTFEIKYILLFLLLLEKEVIHKQQSEITINSAIFHIKIRVRDISMN